MVAEDPDVKREEAEEEARRSVRAGRGRKEGKGRRKVSSRRWIGLGRRRRRREENELRSSSQEGILARTGRGRR